MVNKDDIQEDSVFTDPDLNTHIENIQNTVDAGYDHVYMHQIGDDQEALLELYEKEVLPSFE
jgi:coenzyme F420-dependent glucose-6-phosphate dehydrogenase